MMLQNKLSSIAKIIGHNYEGDKYHGRMVNIKEFNKWCHQCEGQSKWIDFNTLETKKMRN